MLHHSNFILAFFAIFISMLFIVFARTDATVYSSKQNTQYGSRLTAASHSAVQSLEPRKILDGEYLWDTAPNRSKTMNAFYYALASSFMQTTNDMSLQVSTPIIILVDTDGYYLGYNALFDWDNIADTSKVAEFENALQMTDLTSWGEERYGYHIRYYLNDHVSVITGAGKRYEGKRKDVSTAMAKDGITGDIIDYIDPDGGKRATSAAGDDLGEAFTVYRDELIVRETEETLARYINQYNYNAGVNGGGYKLRMPEISGEMWHRLLSNPTFITFLQGRNVNNGREVINTYAYSGGEFMKSDKFFIIESGGDKVYHSFRECNATGELTPITDPSTGEPTGEYDFAGHSPGMPGGTVTKLIFSMADCAEQGAVPCPDCIR